jgi:hypothetical protein
MLLYLLAVVFVPLFDTRALRQHDKGFRHDGDRFFQAPLGQVPKCPEDTRKEPYNQRLEGFTPFAPHKAFLPSEQAWQA